MASKSYPCLTTREATPHEREKMRLEKRITDLVHHVGKLTESLEEARDMLNAAHSFRARVAKAS